MEMSKVEAMKVLHDNQVEVSLDDPRSLAEIVNDMNLGVIVAAESIDISQVAE